MSVQEKWRPVVGWESLYEVSNLGRVRSFDRFVESSDNRKARFQSGRIMKPTPTPKGYLRVRLCGVFKCLKLVHVLVAQAFIGDAPPGMEVNHKDGVKANCSADNLEYETRGGNILHAYRTGLRQNLKGDYRYSKKFPNWVCAAMVERHDEGDTVAEIARSYKTSQVSIKRIINRFRATVPQ